MACKCRTPHSASWNRHTQHNLTQSWTPWNLYELKSHSTSWNTHHKTSYWSKLRGIWLVTVQKPRSANWNTQPKSDLSPMELGLLVTSTGHSLSQLKHNSVYNLKNNRCLLSCEISRLGYLTRHHLHGNPHSSWPIHFHKLTSSHSHDQNFWPKTKPSFNVTKLLFFCLFLFFVLGGGFCAQVKNPKHWHLYHYLDTRKHGTHW